MNDTTFQGNGKITYVPVVVNAKPPKQTNADKVRSMTDDEIEEWFWWMHKEMMRYTDSRVFLHDWLKQEVDG